MQAQSRLYIYKAVIIHTIPEKTNSLITSLIPPTHKITKTQRITVKTSCILSLNNINALTNVLIKTLKYNYVKEEIEEAVHGRK